jgi:hypothetical protein
MEQKNGMMNTLIQIWLSTYFNLLGTTALH